MNHDHGKLESDYQVSVRWIHNRGYVGVVLIEGNDVWQTPTPQDNRDDAYNTACYRCDEYLARAIAEAESETTQTDEDVAVYLADIERKRA